MNYSNEMVYYDFSKVIFHENTAEKTEPKKCYFCALNFFKVNFRDIA